VTANLGIGAGLVRRVAATAWAPNCGRPCLQLERLRPGIASHKESERKQPDADT